jgi:hypothetical protein
MLKLLGRQTLHVISGFGDFALFTGTSFSSAVKSRRLARRIARAVYEQGTLCLPVVLIVGTFTGLVLGLQGYYVLSRFDAEGLLGALVSLSLVREMAPVLTALVLVGQAGSALAAELGIQRNSEQIVALETMGRPDSASFDHRAVRVSTSSSALRGGWFMGRQSLGLSVARGGTGDLLVLSGAGRRIAGCAGMFPESSHFRPADDQYLRLQRLQRASLSLRDGRPGGQ